MQFKKNAHVITAQGRKIGRIDRVVVDPTSGEVSHLVIKKGLLLTEEKVVPVDAVAATTDDEVRLTESAPDPEALPQFEKEAYIPARGYKNLRRQQAEEARRMIWYHTGINTPWWVGGPDLQPSKPLFVREKRRSIPKDTVPLEEGAEVQDAHGEKVGKVVEVFAEPEEHRVTHILVALKGLSMEKKLVPSVWIKDVFEKSVRLSVDRGFVSDLPPAS
jgi:uncharacterized protein YrrD